MPRYYFYDRQTGEFDGRSIDCHESAIADNTPAGCGAAPDVSNWKSARMDVATGELQSGFIPPLPPDTDMETHSWDSALGAVVKAPTAKAIAEWMRAQRDGVLGKTDWVVTKAAEFGEPVPEEWRAYRQALRDLTDQPGFPDSVEWPTPPA